MSRMDKISGEVRESFYKSLEKDKNEEITERLVNEISEQIEQCLMPFMAEVVEIPLRLKKKYKENRTIRSIREESDQ